jgi:uncharacterized membrane protein
LQLGVRMLLTVALLLLYILFPALIVFLETKRIAFIDRIGAVVICYAAGLILGNAGVLPKEAASVQDILTTAAIPLALPLMFFSLDIVNWRKTGRKAILSFGLETIAVIVVSAVGFLIFRGTVGPETNKLAGMLTGVYTGGTINLVAIATALKTSPTLLVAANASDIVISAVYLLFLMTIGRRVIGVFLPSYTSGAGSSAVVDGADYGSYKGIFSREILPPLLAAFAVALLIAAAGASLTLLLPGTWGTVAAILAITTLGIAASFIKPLRAVKKTYQLGNYFILVFCLAIGSMADLGKLATAMPAVIGYVTLAVFGSMALHIALCALARVDTDTMIITSVAGICSPPFVPMVATALKNKEIILAGIVTGIVGWVIGTYIGVGLSYLLSGIGP